MDYKDQSITGLEAAYLAVFHRQLIDRVRELCQDYKYPDKICCELHDKATVPCFWKISELADHYNIII